MDLNLFDTKPLTSVQVTDPIKQVTTTAQPGPAQQKPTFWDNLFKAADSAANVITAVKQPAGNMPVTYAGGTYYQPAPPPQNNTMKTVLIVGGVLLAGGIAYAVLKPKSKK